MKPTVIALCALFLLAAAHNFQGADAVVTCSAAGDAATFAIIAATTATNAAASTVVGDIGTSPGTSITGFNEASVTGVIHDNPPNDAASKLAIASAGIAYACAADLPCGFNLTQNSTLENATLAGGVYCFESSTSIPAYGVLTLDGGGDASTRWVFQIKSAFLASTHSSVVMIGSGLPGNVFWQIGSSATIDDSATLVGTVMAYQDVDFKTSATLNGRAMALNGQVTLTTSTIIIGDCTATLCTTGSPSTAPSVSPSTTPSVSPSTSPSVSPSVSPSTAPSVSTPNTVPSVLNPSIVPSVLTPSPISSEVPSAANSSAVSLILCLFVVISTISLLY